MKRKKTKKSMLGATIVMGILALIFFIIATRQGAGKNIEGIRIAYKLTIQILPILVFAFLIAGFTQVLLPEDLLSKWVGTEAGFKGILIGTLAGAITPGGPYVSLPIVAVLLNSGASAGTMVAFLSSWSLWAIARLPMEVGILGAHFTLVRFISVLIFPPIIGLFANIIAKILNYN
jgi:uncharacterized protein